MAYGLAMLAYACDFAFNKRQVAVAAPARADREKVAARAVLVGAASGPDLAGQTFGADPADVSQLADLDGQGGDVEASGGAGPGTRAQSHWPTGPWPRTASVLTCIALVIHLAPI